MKTVKIDYWDHQKLSEEILMMIRSSIKYPNDLDELDGVPKLKKPYFWEFWKFSEYNRECRRILKEVKDLLTDLTKNEN
jgi:hypothetical protein